MRVDLTILKKIFLYIISVLYLSDMPFFFLPFIVRTRFFLGIIGILIFFLYYLRHLKIKEEIFYNILWLLALLFPFIITIIINNNVDSWGFRAVLNVFVFFAAFLVVYLYEKIDTIDFEKIVKFIVNVVLINIIIAIIMFLIEPFKQFIFRLQGQGIGAEDAIYYVSSFRLVGVGNFFFYQAGVFCAWGLILVTYFLKRKTSLRWLLIYLIILISGIFFARTTFIGFLTSLLYYIYPDNMSKKEIVAFVKKIISVCFFFLLLIFCFNVFLKDILLENNDVKMLTQAFELFINYSQSGKLESDSTNHLSEMYIYPDNLKTWILGDGRFTAEDGIHYYKGTDVGYLRILFFMGIFGLLVMYFQKIYLLYTTIKLKNYKLLQYKHLIYFLFLLTLILNFKGFTDLDIIIFIFFWYLLLVENKKKNLIIEGR
jgi:hypothetical protein